MPRTHRFLAVALSLPLIGFSASGCSSQTTRETEFGVLVCKLSIGCANKGVQEQTYAPGSTTFFAPFIRDFYVFDTKMQNLEMVTDPTRGDRKERDDLQFKTNDGNDISMDVTVAWQIDPKRCPDILMNVGTSTEAVKDKLVRPMARTLVRDVLNELDSESVYNSDKRFEKAEKAKTVLTDALSPYGITIVQVILGEHRFNPEYEKVIHDRKLAEQKAQQLKSEADAAAQEAIRNLETARGEVASTIAQADGELAQAKLTADAQYYQQEQDAQAIVAERAAKAQAIAKRNEALKGVGGRAMVKLRIAEALAGKPIILIPGGAGSAMGVNRLDLNKLLDSAILQSETATEKGN